MARQCLCRLRWRVLLLPLSLFLVVGVFRVGIWPKTISVLEFSETGRKFQAPELGGSPERHRADNFSVSSPTKPVEIQSEDVSGPYHNWELFAADYEEMIKTLRIFVYPDVYLNKSSPLATVFLPHPDPSKQGNYFSEHMFKAALLRSSVQTRRPEDAHFFFMPFSINAMRNHRDLHSAAAISDFVAGYAARISSEFEFWNASGGADHFYAYCHSIGRTAASKHRVLHHNAIQVTCSSSYFQRMYISHKDVGLSQVWPRQQEQTLNPPNASREGKGKGTHVGQTNTQHVVGKFGNSASVPTCAARDDHRDLNWSGLVPKGSLQLSWLLHLGRQIRVYDWSMSGTTIIFILLGCTSTMVPSPSK